jgi:hypothetical protein
MEKILYSSMVDILRKFVEDTINWHFDEYADEFEFRSFPVQLNLSTYNRQTVAGDVETYLRVILPVETKGGFIENVILASDTLQSESDIDIDGMAILFSCVLRQFFENKEQWLSNARMASKLTI